MSKSFVNAWLKLIRPLFPKNARIEIDAENDVICELIGNWEMILLGQIKDRD